MPDMNATYRNLLATHGASLITHIGLVDSTDAEVSVERKPVVWTAPADGLIRPDADIDFDILAGNNVAGWRGYSALAGGTEYGGKGLTQVNFAGNGVYTLEAANTAILHS